MRYTLFTILKMAKNTEKFGKCEMHTGGPGIWRETLKKVENEKFTLQDLEYGDKPGDLNKYEKHTGRTWNMARNIEMWKMEKHTFGPLNMAIKLKNMEKETHRLQDLEYGEKIDK